MKKIIALLIVSSFLFSCTNTKQEEIIKEPTVNENIPTANEESNTGSEIKTIEVTEEEYIETPETVVTETVEIGSSTGEITIEEEKILESEVNDLLNEFIDSLDNYDK